MPRLNASSDNFVPGGEKVVQRGAGRLVCVVASHLEAEAQTVTFYDSLLASGAMLLRLRLPAGGQPTALTFPEPLRFSHGLAVAAGKCDVFVMTVGE